MLIYSLANDWDSEVRMRAAFQIGPVRRTPRLSRMIKVVLNSYGIWTARAVHIDEISEDDAIGTPFTLIC